MVLLEQYITLYEKRWQNVFLGWKYFQILIYFLATVFGVLAGFSWTMVNYSFDDDCFLYSNVTFVNRGGNDGAKGSDVNKEISQFEKDTYCSFCQYVSVCSVLFGAIWLTFFTMCGRGGRSDHGLPQPWRIVYPAMLFNVAYFLFSLVSVIWLEEGYGKFCKAFMDNNNKMKYANMLQKSGIYICLLFGVMADWVKLPVLDPHKHEPFIPPSQYSYLQSSSNFLKVSTYAPVTTFSSSIYPGGDSNSMNKIPLGDKHLLTESVQNKMKSDQIELAGNTSTQSHQMDENKHLNPEIDYKFLLSVMNNSQKIDKTGLENTYSESKVNPFFEVLKNVHHTLLHGTPITLIGKIQFLQDLQTKLYSYIKPRIKRLWNVEDRQARTEKGMGFPSMDGALMTICFLLFAVFLIKLVKQLIQQLQEKANANALMMTGATPVVPAAGGTVMQGRRKRDISAETYAAARILHLIESFHVQYKLAAPQ